MDRCESGVLKLCSILDIFERFSMNFVFYIAVGNNTIFLHFRDRLDHGTQKCSSLRHCRGTVSNSKQTKKINQIGIRETPRELIIQPNDIFYL